MLNLSHTLDFINSTKNVWQKCHNINIQDIYVWFLEHNIKMKLLTKFEHDGYIQYYLLLQSADAHNLSNIISSLPFGNILIEKIVNDGKNTCVYLHLTLSSLLPNQTLNLKTSFEPVKINLSGIFKKADEYYFCLNEKWYSIHDTLPNNMSVETVNNSFVVVQLSNFGLSKSYKIFIGQTITVEPQYDF
ncbi:MAG: hypothetical protein H6845_00990 [Alphaproteobacteria bacterium]|nr:MAG: hypothetical protein H6845_00990 [Alphaproteobacteria bacterium]